MIELPIDEHIPCIIKKLQQSSVLFLKSSPGSGKTTRLPWAVSRVYEKKIIVLEPRRLAAKMAAERIAEERSLTIGLEVGYHFRFEKRLSPKSKIIFYTEGTFLKMLQNQNFLSDVEVVIFDEFHERHIETDLCLGILLKIQEKMRHLKLIIMSATLNLENENILTRAELYEFESNRYDVEIHHLPNIPSILSSTLPQKIKKTLRETKEISGNVLIFVPGMKEMLQIQEHIGQEFGVVLFLHSEISKEEQKACLIPNNEKKIILATNIAESSLTIPDVTVVIDSGIQRKKFFSPWTGLSKMADVPTSQSSSTQRTGRAGRTQNGKCYRLFSELDFQQRKKYDLPEILQNDLLEVYLLSKQFGEDFEWLTPPSPNKWELTKKTAQKLGLVTEDGVLTEIARQITALPFDPRISLILTQAEKLNRVEQHKLIAFLRNELKIEMHEKEINFIKINFKNDEYSKVKFEQTLLCGFIDQVARFRDRFQDFIHYSGSIFKAFEKNKYLDNELYLLFEISPKNEAKLVLHVEEEWPYLFEPFPFDEKKELILDQGEIRTTESISLGAIVIEVKKSKKKYFDLSFEEKKYLGNIVENIFIEGWKNFTQSPSFQRFCFWWSNHEVKKENIRPETDLDLFFLSFEKIQTDSVSQFFEQKLLSEINEMEFNYLAPTHIKLNSSKNIVINYHANNPPSIECFIQDLYGLKETPAIWKGSIKLNLIILGPHKRPVQITSNLEDFWKKTYKELKREFQREYPKHYWSEKPESDRPIMLKKNLVS